MIMEGDKVEDRVIVYCSSRSLSSCYSGIYIVPTYARHYDNKGKFAEYVEFAKSNKNWIIATTVEIANSNINYWIINKNFSLES